MNEASGYQLPPLSGSDTPVGEWRWADADTHPGSTDSHADPVDYTEAERGTRDVNGTGWMPKRETVPSTLSIASPSLRGFLLCILVLVDLVPYGFWMTSLAAVPTERLLKGPIATMCLLRGLADLANSTSCHLRLHFGIKAHVSWQQAHAHASACLAQHCSVGLLVHFFVAQWTAAATQGGADRVLADSAALVHASLKVTTTMCLACMR